MRDNLDLDLVAALQYGPRAPFDVLGEVLGCTSRTVARRYEALVRSGVMRMICEVDWSYFANGGPVNVWVRTSPSRATSVAARLAARMDTTYVSQVSGQQNILCMLHGETRGATTNALLDELATVPGVNQFSVEHVLSLVSSAASWRLPRLDGRQIATLRCHGPEVRSSHDDSRHQWTELERRLGAVLRENARCTYAELGRELGISESRARRSARELFASNLLRPRVQIEPRLLGYDFETVLRMKTLPSQAGLLADRLAGHPSIRFLAITTSSHSLMALGLFRDEVDFASFLAGGWDRGCDLRDLRCSTQLRVIKRYWSNLPASIP